MACTLYIHSFKVTTRKFHHHIPLKTFLTSLTAFKVQKYLSNERHEHTEPCQYSECLFPKLNPVNRKSLVKQKKPTHYWSTT